MSEPEDERDGVDEVHKRAKAILDDVGCLASVTNIPTQPIRVPRPSERQPHLALMIATARCIYAGPKHRNAFSRAMCWGMMHDPKNLLRIEELFECHNIGSVYSRLQHPYRESGEIYRPVPVIIAFILAGRGRMSPRHAELMENFPHAVLYLRKFLSAEQWDTLLYNLIAIFHDWHFSSNAILLFRNPKALQCTIDHWNRLYAFDFLKWIACESHYFCVCRGLPKDRAFREECMIPCATYLLQELRRREIPITRIFTHLRCLLQCGHGEIIYPLIQWDKILKEEIVPTPFASHYAEQIVLYEEWKKQTNQS